MDTACIGESAVQPATNVLEFMVFILGEQEYAIDLSWVRELRSHIKVYPTSGAPAYISGTIDLRGNRVPLVDMRMALKTGLPSLTTFSDVVVCSVAGETVAAAVDAVVDVVKLTAAHIAPAPLHADYQIGVAILGDRRLILIDIDAFLPDVRPLPGLRAA